MTRKIASLGFSIAAFVLGLSATRNAHAVDYYRAGKVLVSLERVFGLHYWHTSVERANPLNGDDVSSGTVIGIGWYGARSPYHWGRAAVDGFIIDRLSLGGSIGFYSQSGDADGSGFLIYPRVGYVIPISNVFSFWPRGGFSYMHFENTSPAGAFPPNGYGLYDIIGNVWEWTTDWYVPKHPQEAAKACCIPRNPRGPRAEESYDPCQPRIKIPRKVLKGGSHLCAPNYCRRYRPAARFPEPVDTSTCHVGSRCVVREKSEST